MLLFIFNCKGALDCCLMKPIVIFGNYDEKRLLSKHILSWIY